MRRGRRAGADGGYASRTPEQLAERLIRLAARFRRHEAPARIEARLLTLVFLKWRADEQISTSRVGEAKYRASPSETSRESEAWNRIRRRLQSTDARVLADEVDHLAQREPETYEGAAGLFTLSAAEETGGDVATLLAEAVAELDAWDLSREALGGPDAPGDLFQEVAERFALQAGRGDYGEFQTPAELAVLLAELLEVSPGMTVCDPVVGSGSTLVACARHVRDRALQSAEIQVFGQELDPHRRLICVLNLVVHGQSRPTIRVGDVLRAPALVDGDRLMRFDRVVANPPFSLADWGADEAKIDPFRRFQPSAPPPNRAELAFVQHIVATLDERHGRAAVVLPLGALSRTGREASIRRDLVERDLVAAVIRLPYKLFFGPRIAAAVLVLDRAKPAEGKGRVLFVDASDEHLYRAEPGRTTLLPAGVLWITAVVRAMGDPARVEAALGSLVQEWRRAAERRRRRTIGALAHAAGMVRERVEEVPASRREEIDEAVALARARLPDGAGGGSLGALSAVVPTAALLAADPELSLDPAHHLARRVLVAERPDVASRLATIQELERERDRAAARVDELLGSLAQRADRRDG